MKERKRKLAAPASNDPADVARFELADAHCHAPGCEARKREGEIFCARHMGKLPLGLRAELKAASFKTGFLDLYARAKDVLAGRAAQCPVCLETPCSHFHNAASGGAA